VRRAVTGLLGWSAVSGLGVGGWQAPAPASSYEDPLVWAGTGCASTVPTTSTCSGTSGRADLAIGVVALVALTAMAFRLPAAPGGRPGSRTAGHTGRFRAASRPGPGTRPPSPRGASPHDDHPTDVR
jgi:hypothetical protein